MTCKCNAFGKVEIRQRDLSIRISTIFLNLKPIWKVRKEGEVGSNILHGIHNCHISGKPQKSFKP